MRYLAAVLAAALALSASACLKPATKQTGYLVNGAAVLLGTVTVVDAQRKDCSGMNLGDSVGCGLSKDTGMVIGPVLIGAGVLGLVLTAMSDAPDTP
jgi:hypothetical protein